MLARCWQCSTWSSVELSPGAVVNSKPLAKGIPSFKLRTARFGEAR